MGKLIDVRSSRRAVLKATAVLGGAAALKGFGSIMEASLSPARAQGLEISTLRSTSRSWLWVVEDFGMEGDFFQTAGLRVGTASTERGTNHDALLTGAADILLGAPQQNMRVQILGQPVFVFAGFVNKFASNVVIKKEIADRLGIDESSPVMDKARALEGLRMGTTGPGGGPDQLLRYFLGRAGFDPDTDAQLVRVQGGSAMIAAMQQDQIDGFCLSSPTSDLAVRDADATYLFNMANNPPPELEDFLYITASAKEETAQEKSDALVAYCRGCALAMKTIHEDPETFKQWSRAWFESMDDELFEISYANNINIFMETPVPTQAQFDLNRQFLADTLAATGQDPIPDDYGFEDAFRLEFVNEAMASL